MLNAVRVCLDSCLRRHYSDLLTFVCCTGERWQWHIAFQRGVNSAGVAFPCRMSPAENMFTVFLSACPGRII